MATPFSTTSELNSISGTPDGNPRDEDVDSITTSDEYYDARSLFSMRTLKSSLRRIVSASRASLVSTRSMLFAPSLGAHQMNIRQLVEYLQTRHQLSKMNIMDMTTYHSQSVIKHMFVVLRLRQGGKESWLRLDRRAEDPFGASFLFSGMHGPARDIALGASKLGDLIDSSDAKPHSRIAFEKPPSLKALESLLIAIYEESKDYRIWPENCWFFCSLMQEHLSGRHGGHFTFGELYRPTMGSDARARITGRLDGIRLSDLSAPWSLSLLYKVVPRPLTPSSVIGEATIPGWYYSCYLLFTPDGNRVLTGSVGAIRVWDLSLRELIKIPTEDASQVGSWARLLDDHVVVSGMSEESYSFWDATFSTPIRFCTASRRLQGFDFTQLASAPDDLTAQRWEKVIHDTERWQGDPSVRSKTHNRVGCVSGGTISVDDKSVNSRIANVNVGPQLREEFTLSPSGKSISFRLHTSRHCFLWNIDTQTVYQLDRTLSDPPFFGTEWSPDGHYIAIERDWDVTLRDTRTGALVSILDFDHWFVGRLHFSPNGRYVAIVRRDGAVKLWDVKISLLRGPYRSNRPLGLRDGVVDTSKIGTETSSTYSRIKEMY